MKKMVFVLGLSLFGACSFAKELATGKGLGYGSTKVKLQKKILAKQLIVWQTRSDDKN